MEEIRMTNARQWTWEVKRPGKVCDTCGGCFVAWASLPMVRACTHVGGVPPNQ